MWRHTARFEYLSIVVCRRVENRQLIRVTMNANVAEIFQGGGVGAAVVLSCRALVLLCEKLDQSRDSSCGFPAKAVQ